MDWSDLRTWYEDLEPHRAWRWVGAAVVAASLLVPWRREAAVEAAVRPQEGQSYPLLAPAPGRVRDVKVEKDAVLEPGTVVLTYAAQADAAPYPPSPASAASYAATMDDERRIRENYQRQVREAYTYITSFQQQLSRAWAEARIRPRGGVPYEVQLAQNALERAQAAPAELNRKMEQELAALHRNRDSGVRSFMTVPAVQAYRGPAGGEDLPVRVEERVQVVGLPVHPGSLLAPGGACADLLPEGAAMAVLAAVPARLAGDLRVGMPATLEVDAWLHDAETLPLVLEKVGNRRLEPGEVAALAPKAPREESYILVTGAPLRAEGRLFPPPGNCRIHLAGIRRCLLQRLLF